MNNQRIVSVIIPTYKNRGGLLHAIDSVLNQTYKSIEVLVVDDNSPGTEGRLNTETLMEKYTGDERVVYIRHQKNTNGSAARNTGFHASHGDYIAFLDDDDTFLPEKIAKEKNFLEARPEFDAAYTFEYVGDLKPIITPYEGDVTKELLMLKSHMQTSTLMFRRSALVRINGFDETFIRHQDYEMLLRFFQKGMKIGCLQEYLTKMEANNGENIPSGDKLEMVKRSFFSAFADTIDTLDKEVPGFRKQMEAKHYAGVFLSHVKHRFYSKAIHVLVRYFFNSPSVFLSVLLRSVKAHM